MRGREKGALARHLGQVMNWKGEFYQLNEKAADGAMLIVNGWRKLPLDQRADKGVFEHNLVSDAERESILEIMPHRRVREEGTCVEGV